MFKSHRSTLRAFVMLALSVMSLARPAEANSSADGLPSVTVHYSDLNLQNPAAAVTLYARIHAAAVTVCSLPGDAESGGPWLRIKQDRCVSQAVAKAVQTVHDGQLSAYHWAKVRGWKRRSGEITLAESAH